SAPGHTVVFADQSGMNASGEVLLGTMDVHHQWNKLFQQLPSYQSLQQQTDWLKERISDLLGGSQVINLERLGPIQPISEHYMTLSTFHQSLMSRCLRLHPRSLHGLTLVLERKYHCISAPVFYYVSALFSQTPSLSWQMATHTEPGSGSAGGFFLLNKSFLLHCQHMHAPY
ncbi:hypothetical protein CHARACLAT_023062, partial [Characodon lateralis]|nr:hypothetical protein [Characodon lateralis]